MGGDVEFISPVINHSNGSVDGHPSDGQIPAKTRFKKGHKRAWSMPNAHHRDKVFLVITEDNLLVYLYMSNHIYSLFSKMVRTESIS
jgi:hypothetical protein